MEPSASPTAEDQSEDGEDVDLELGGTDWEIGYDFVETEGGDQWHIWMNGEVIIIDADDDSAGTRLTAFMTQADKRAQARTDIEAAEVAMAIGAAGTFLGGIATFGSGIVTVASCAATPLTFLAGGGTGWLCVGGALGTTALAGLTWISIRSGLQGLSDRSDAAEHLKDSSREAEQLFNSIRDQVDAQP